MAISGTVFYTSRIEYLRASKLVHVVRVCVDGLAHVSYEIRSTLAGDVVVRTALVPNREQISACDNSCKRRALRSYVEERVYAEPSDDAADEAKEADARWNAFCASLHLDPQVKAREFAHVLYQDGDSDSAMLCTGYRHIRRTCMEFGMESEFEDAGDCDHRTCRRVHVRLPGSVARTVNAFLASPQKPESA